MARKRNAAARPRDASRSKNAQWWSLLLVLTPVLVPVLCSALGVLSMPAFEEWRSTASLREKMLVPAVVAVLVVALLGGVAYALVARRGRKVAVPTSPTNRRALLLAGLGAAASGLYLALKRAQQVEEEQLKRLIIVCGTDIDSIEFGSTTLRRCDLDGVRRFVLEAAQLPERLALDVSTQRGEWRWTQQVELVGPWQGEHDGIHRVLSSLDWRAGNFVSPGREDPGMIRERLVVAYLPGEELGEGCNSLPGKSLAAGIRMFCAGERRITVRARQDGKELEANEVNHIALVGSYNSNETYRLFERNRNKPGGCGAIVTLSSSVGLRRNEDDPRRPDNPPWIIRMTSDNASRARDLVDLLSQELAAESGTPALYIVYVDESEGHEADEIHYATDQAQELRKALRETALAPRVVWIRYKHVHRDAPGPLAIFQGAPDVDGMPSEVPRSLSMNTFEQLIRRIRAEGVKRVVFVDRDVPVLRFGQALQAEYDREPVGTRVAYFVPGPREVLEGVWLECLNAPTRDPRLEGVIVVGPDYRPPTVGAKRYAVAWAKLYGDRPVSARAAREYDALQVVERAIIEVDETLTEAKRYVDIHVYRRLVRRRIIDSSFSGASGLIVFSSSGDLYVANVIYDAFAEGAVAATPREPKPIGV